MQFLSGAMMMASWVISLFFIKFWRKTDDHFFLLFGSAFFLLGCERLAMAFFNPSEETRFYVYTVRLLSFIIIIGAIAHKNRSTRTARRLHPSEA